MVPIVQIREPGRTPLHLALHQPVDVGRDCDGLLLASHELSRRHLRLSSATGHVIVEDLGSTNGSFVDGSAINGVTGIQIGQVVAFGGCQLEVVADRSTGATAAMVDDPQRRTSIDAVAAATAAQPVPEVLDRSGTLTIVFCDIENSTRWRVSLGEERWLALLNFHQSLVRRHVERIGGLEIGSQGDGFMLAFSTARSAVQCSLEIMRSLDAHARSHPTEGIRVRIGMHTAEAILEDGFLFEGPIVLAARIANQARGAEILVSSLVREIVESGGDLAFGESRQVALNGLPGTFGLHPVAWRVRRG